MIKKLLLILGITALNANASDISPAMYTKLFKGYNACFILYDVNANKTLTEYNPNNRCQQRIPANSTFKVALSLMAFNQGIINESTVFKFNWAKSEKMTNWNHDQTSASWIKYSVVPVSQLLTRQLGMARIRHYLAGLAYGNEDFSGDRGKNNGLTDAWLSSSLKISAIEQRKFLQAMLNNELPINDYAVAITKQNMYLGKLTNGWSYYGKTGAGNSLSGNIKTKKRDGWFVGFIENKTQRYVFVTNVSDIAVPDPRDKRYAGTQIAMPITLEILNNYFH